MTYVLGYTLADGNVMVTCNTHTKKKSNTRPIYKLSWCSIDKELLEFIKKDMQATYPITLRKYVDPRCKNPKPVWEFTISSKELVTDIMTLGLLPRKSKTVVFQEWYPEEYMPDYIRGIIDGDGSWTTNGQKKQLPRFTMTAGSKVFLEGFGEFLRGKLGIIPKIYPHGTNNFRINYGSREVAALYYYVYHSNSENFYLQRKYDRATELVKGYDLGRCQSCKKLFMRIAGLQAICYTCKQNLYEGSETEVRKTLRGCDTVQTSVKTLAN